MINLAIVFFFILGLLVGSFLNVLIFRFNTKKLFKGRSICLSCEKKLSWHELVPLFSFLIQKGRCNSCKSKLSFQYPIVEFLTGILFVFLFFKLNPNFVFDLYFYFTYLFFVILFSVLLIIIVYDIKHKIIPDSLSLLFFIFSFLSIFLFLDFKFAPHIPSLYQIFSPFLAALPFFLFWLISSGKWMGLGDAKLMAGVGFLLGLSGAFSAMVFAFWSGAIIGLLLLFLDKKKNMKSEIPFAPFIIFGIFVVFFFNIFLF